VVRTNQTNRGEISPNPEMGAVLPLSVKVNAALGRIVTAPTNGSRSNSVRIDVLSGN
jgi:L-serine deaminase